MGRMSHAMGEPGFKMAAQNLPGRGQAPEYDMAIESQSLGCLLIGKAFERNQQQRRAMAEGQGQKSWSQIRSRSGFRLRPLLLEAKKRPVKLGPQIWTAIDQRIAQNFMDGAQDRLVGLAPARRIGATGQAGSKSPEARKQREDFSPAGQGRDPGWILYPR